MTKWIKKDSCTSVTDVFLRNMNCKNLEEINDWFRKSMNDEYYINGLDVAVTKALEHKDDVVCIMGDYDADGVSSVCILLLGLKAAGFTNVIYDIPRRESEGFGLNKNMIDRAQIKNTSLIITCDNGVAQVDSINYAKSLGMEVIITDHHEASINGLPDTDIIIDPNAIENQAAFNGYCGAGICYKFIKAMFARIGLEDKITLDKLLGFAAIATIADVMELEQENYVFVRNGLKVLSRLKSTSGLNAIIQTLDIQGHIVANDIGFKLGPIINAQSRMFDDGAMNAVKAFSFEGDSKTALAVAEKMIKVNSVRKGIQKKQVSDAELYISDNDIAGQIPMVVRVDDCPAGIIGIVAGHITEKYQTPSIVFCKTPEGILKGSARSLGEYNIFEELNKVSEHIIKHGGHKGAAGLSIKESEFENFTKAITSNAPSDIGLGDKDVVYYDLEVSVNDIPDVIKEIEKYEPWGKGNEAPVFKVTDFTVIPKSGVYKYLVTPTIVRLYGSNVDAIGFDMVEDLKTIENPKVLDFIGNLSNNVFRGNSEPQIEFKHFKVKEFDKVETDLAATLKFMALH